MVSQSATIMLEALAAQEAVREAAGFNGVVNESQMGESSLGFDVFEPLTSLW